MRWFCIYQEVSDEQTNPAQDSHQGDHVLSLDNVLHSISGHQTHSFSVRNLFFYLASTVMAIKKATSGAENAHMLLLRSAVRLLHQAQIQQCLSCLCFPPYASWWKQTPWGLAGVKVGDLAS